MEKFDGDLDALVEDKIGADTEFQDSLIDLPDDEKEQLITEKKSEVLKQEFTDLHEKAEKVDETEEKAENYKIRAEKAEAAAKKPEEKETPKNDYSLSDIRALADVHDDDVDELVKLAKSREITVAEAKVDPYIKSYLKTKKDERETAEATNTGGARKGATKANGSKLLSDAESTGNLPESDEGMDDLVKARVASKK